MASLRRKDRSAFWYACFTLPDGKRCQRSTRIIADGGSHREQRERRREAQALADAWEDDFRQAATVRQAQRVAADIVQRLHHQPVTLAPPLASWLRDWADAHAGQVSDATLRYYRSKVASFLGWLDDDQVTLDRFGDAEALAYRDHEAGELAPRTVNNAVKTLRSAWESARRKGVIVDNPWDGIRALKTPPTKRRPFRPEELRALLDVAPLEWQSMIRFGYYTGQRLRDIALLRWSAIDLTALEVRIVTSKTTRHVHSPIGSGLEAHIATLTPPADPAAPVHPMAFESVERSGQVNSLSVQFGDLLAAAGLAPDHRDHKARRETASRRRPRQELSFHSLRDTATTALKAAGVDGPVAQEIIGHESAAMSRIYTKFSAEDLRAAVDRLPTV